jgi:hypothetical protein
MSLALQNISTVRSRSCRRNDASVSQKQTALCLPLHQAHGLGWKTLARYIENQMALRLHCCIGAKGMRACDQRYAAYWLVVPTDSAGFPNHGESTRFNSQWLGPDSAAECYASSSANLHKVHV